MTAIRPLLASYGGGHAQIITALTKGFLDRGDLPNIIGFTTGYHEMLQQGIDANSITELLVQEEDQEWLDLAELVTRNHKHPAITKQETLTYFALGLKDLSNLIGRTEALKKVQTEGRKAFEPIETMRRYIKKHKPDIVITTTSPRFELALLKAARRENVPCIAIGDLFLITESEWILQPEYADHIAVLSQEVADKLSLQGFPDERLHVTGNPAFDKLINVELGKRGYLRQTLDIQNKKVILFPAAGGVVSKMGRMFLDIENVISQFESFCTRNPEFTYIIRTHPNRPLKIQKKIKHGYLDNGSFLSPEDAIVISDFVCVENSTMGLQAALVGKPTICIRFSDQVLYPNFGMAKSAASLEEAITLLEFDFNRLDGQFQTVKLGTATANVLNLVDKILQNKLESKSFLGRKCENSIA